MNLTLREKLRLPAGCTEAHLQDTCSRYYTIYKGVLDSASDESVRAIAHSKLEDLVASAKAEEIYLKDMDLYAWESVPANTPASVEERLTSLGTVGRIADSEVRKLSDMIARLPDSAKRHYLDALLTLRSEDSSINTYRNAVDKLKYAVINDPDNPVYSVMISDIEREIDRYGTELAQWRKDRETELKNEQFKETLKGVGSVLGAVFLLVIGAVATIATALLECICSLMDN